ncbi:MAG: glycoside hydrolase family 127 protein [Armatimonadetes bacterium]|nr:glycoside hydrolase family 127 protein [Armatimonadota bacterium]
MWKRFHLTLLWAVLCGTVAQAASPVPFTRVKVQDRFWTPRQVTNARVTIKHAFAKLEEEGYNSNFELAAKGARTGFRGLVFNDSDPYKVLEAASYVLAVNRDPEIEKLCDELIERIRKAQMSDGYLDTYFQINAPEKRWTNLRDLHELYCAGHLIEAAVAHHQATGKSTLLNVATKLADHIDAHFGPGKAMGYPGHPELELALYKLADETKNDKYAKLSEFFLKNRGSKFFATEHQTPLDQYDGTYWLDDMPLVDRTQIAGHAVRAGYLLAGATDYAIRSRDPKWISMLDRVWENTTEKRMFITGGLGPSGSNEGFTNDYDLPTDSAYQETCASIANVLWNFRLLQLHGNAKYADVMERAMYNGVLSGGELNGEGFFYTNPLADDGNHRRTPWFGCACCPPNFARLVASAGGYAYLEDKTGVWVNLYMAGAAQLKVGAVNVDLKVTTDYPWSGGVQLEINPDKPGKWTLHLRQPDWCKTWQWANKPTEARFNIETGYWEITRTWKKGDRISFEMKMPVERVVSAPEVEATRGMQALVRGPLVYCLEACDQQGDVAQMSIPDWSKFTIQWEGDLMTGAVSVSGTALIGTKLQWGSQLYQPVSAPTETSFKAIPYCMWANRKPGPMRVWMPTSPQPSPRQGLELNAKVSMSFVSGNCDPKGINDGFVPVKSNITSPHQTHWWPHKGGSEWVAYEFQKPTKVSRARVYWFDDTGYGECRFPKSWLLEARTSDGWKPVQLSPGQTFAISPNEWNEVTFAPIESNTFRIRIVMLDNFAAGIHEWQLFEK